METNKITHLIDFTEAGQFWDDYNITPTPYAYYKHDEPFCHACLLGILAVHHNIIDPDIHDGYGIASHLIFKGLEAAGYSIPYLRGLDHGFTSGYPIKQRWEDWDAQEVWQYVEGVHHGIKVRETVL